MVRLSQTIGIPSRRPRLKDEPDKGVSSLDRTEKERRLLFHLHRLGIRFRGVLKTVVSENFLGRRGDLFRGSLDMHALDVFAPQRAFAGRTTGNHGGDQQQQQRKTDHFHCISRDPFLLLANPFVHHDWTEARLEDEKGTLESCSGIRRTFALLRQRF